MADAHQRFTLLNSGPGKSLRLVKRDAD